MICGGPSVYNPEPIAPFFDVMLIGEGEEQIVEFCQRHRELRDAGVPRVEMLRELSKVGGAYVPSLYEVRHDEPCSKHGYTVPRDGEDVPPVVYKRVVKDFGATNPVPQSIVPYAQIVQDRLCVEVLRGCARGCRFCQAGMTYRPVRERSADQVVSAVTRGLASMGYDEVSLNSLSSTDHSKCAGVSSTGSTGAWATPASPSTSHRSASTPSGSTWPPPWRGEEGRARPSPPRPVASACAT